MNFKVRKLQIKDVPQIIKIGSKVKEFRVSNSDNFWGKKELEALSKSVSDICLVAEEKGEIVGFIITTTNKPAKKVTLENLWIHPNIRTKGEGTKLVKKFLQLCKKKKYEYVMAFTILPKSRLRFFENNGFIVGKKGFWIDKIL